MLALSHVGFFIIISYISILSFLKNSGCTWFPHPSCHACVGCLVKQNIALPIISPPPLLRNFGRGEAIVERSLSVWSSPFHNKTETAWSGAALSLGIALPGERAHCVYPTMDLLLHQTMQDKLQYRLRILYLDCLGQESVWDFGSVYISE